MTDAVYAGIVASLFPGAQLERSERLTGGVSADVYRLDLCLRSGDLTSVVLRAHRPSHTGHPANLEHQLLQTLHNGGLAVPKPLHLDLSGEQLATPFLVMEFIEGSSKPQSTENNRYINLMAEVLTRVHAFPTIALPPLPSRTNTLPEVFDYLPTGPEWSDLRTYLQTIQEHPYSATPKLLHGDFWPENLLWKGNGEVAAILDWEDAALGDPLSDVAGCGLELRYKHGKEGMLHFTETYAKDHEVDRQQLALWQVYVAASAQKFMGTWELEATLEEHMRTEALSTIREAGDLLMAPAAQISSQR